MTDESKPRSSGSPSHSRQRREDLPWQRPKPATEDAEAPLKIERILRSDSYRRSDEDIDFLHADETRGVRLQIEYLKPQLRLDQYGIANTIVVFGSTRLVEPGAAQDEVERLRRALADAAGRPDTSERTSLLATRLARAERVLAKSRYYEVARELGRQVGASGEGPEDCRVVVMTGGGPGVMEAANRGAHEAGARTVGLNIDLPHEQFPNPYVTPELCFRFRYFALRKLHFLLRARALVAFPGGLGTFDEVFETLTLIQTRKIEPIPVVLVGRDYWRRAVDIDFMLEEGVIDEEDRDLFWYAEEAEEIWQGIQAWYEANGRSLFGA